MYLSHCFSNLWKPPTLNCIGCCCSCSYISCSTSAPQRNSHQDVFFHWTKEVKISRGKPQTVWWVIKKFPYQLLNCLLIHTRGAWDLALQYKSSCPLLNNQGPFLWIGLELMTHVSSLVTILLSVSCPSALWQVATFLLLITGHQIICLLLQT